MWDRNLLRVERPARVGAARRVAAAADEIIGGAGMSHRKAVCDDAELGARLAGGLQAQGWRADSLAVMAWPAGRAVAPAPDAGVRELGEGEARVLHEEFSRVAYDSDPELAAQLAGVAGSRMFGAPAGVPQALGRLWLHTPEVAEIDDVGTLPDARGRGFGTAVVLGALEAARDAGARWVFLRADERDWPWTWYARLGFAVVGRQWAFQRAR